MKKDYIVELREEEADELMNDHWVGVLVRCEDCKWAEISDSQHTWCDHVDHEFCHDNDWFCADGERKETT